MQESHQSAAPHPALRLVSPDRRSAVHAPTGSVRPPRPARWEEPRSAWPARRCAENFSAYCPARHPDRQDYPTCQSAWEERSLRRFLNLPPDVSSAGSPPSSRPGIEWENPLATPALRVATGQFQRDPCPASNAVPAPTPPRREASRRLEILERFAELATTKVEA